MFPEKNIPCPIENNFHSLYQIMVNTSVLSIQRICVWNQIMSTTFPVALAKS